MSISEQLYEAWLAQKSGTPGKTGSSTTVTPDPLTDAFLQVRWALLDPAHDEAVTERVLQRIEREYANACERTMSAAKQAAKYARQGDGLKQQIKQHIEAYNHLYKLYLNHDELAGKFQVNQFAYQEYFERSLMSW
jgi:hypothetical protein